MPLWPSYFVGNTEFSTLRRQCPFSVTRPSWPFLLYIARKDTLGCPHSRPAEVCWSASFYRVSWCTTTIRPCWCRLLLIHHLEPTSRTHTIWRKVVSMSDFIICLTSEDFSLYDRLKHVDVELVLNHSTISLQTTVDPEQRYFIQKKLNESGDFNISSVLYTLYDGLNLVRRGGFAFHCEGSTGYPVVAKLFLPEEICDIHEVPFRKNIIQGISLRKHSPFLKMIKTRAFWMIETGIMSKQERHWVPPKPPCFSNGIITSVGFDYIAPLFFFLFIAYTWALIVLIFENIFHFFQLKRKRRNDWIRFGRRQPSTKL